MGRVKKLSDDSKTVRLQLVTTEAWVEEVDAWRGQQPGVPNRSEAIRVLVERGLSAKSPR